MGHLARNRKVAGMDNQNNYPGSFCGCRVAGCCKSPGFDHSLANQVLYAMAAATGLLLVLPVRDLQQGSHRDRWNRFCFDASPVR